MKDLTKIEEILLLAIWNLGQDAYGFRIRRHIAEALGLDLTFGNLYSALGRLDRKGYVLKRFGESAPARRGKTRMYYSLSPSGRKALRSAHDLSLKMWESFEKSTLDFERP